MSYFDENINIEKAISANKQNMDSEDPSTVIAILENICTCMNHGASIYYTERRMELPDGGQVLVAFTSEEETKKEEVALKIADMEDFMHTAKTMEGTTGLIINPFGESFYLTKPLLTILFDAYEQLVPHNQIYLEKGKAAQMDVECVVVEENQLGKAGTISFENKKRGRADSVIYVSAPLYTGIQKEEKQLISCYQNVLELAREKGIHSIAFPALSVGEQKYPMEKAVPVALGAVANWMDAHKQSGMAVVMCTNEEDIYDEFVKYMQVQE